MTVPVPDPHTEGTTMELTDPRVKVSSYAVYPTGYESFVNSDKDLWCLTVVDGHAWGWSIRRGLGGASGAAMNRNGDWIYETRGSGHNKARRWPLGEALAIALQHIDTLRINRATAQEASDHVAARADSLVPPTGDVTDTKEGA